MKTKSCSMQKPLDHVSSSLAPASCVPKLTSKRVRLSHPVQGHISSQSLGPEEETQCAGKPPTGF